MKDIGQLTKDIRVLELQESSKMKLIWILSKFGRMLAYNSCVDFEILTTLNI